MAKAVTLRLDQESYKRLKTAADRRSLGNLIQTAALRYLEESSFTDEAETREILSNRVLLKRLAAGQGAAKRRRGSVVRGL
jgi:hypothetical protein